MGAQEHAPLIACAKHSYTKRIAHALPVTEVERAEASTCGQPCGQRAGQKIAPRDVDHVGKIFLADTTYGGISSISETWNPAESKSGVVPFAVPSNSNISLIFLGPENSSSVGDAFLSLTVSVTAVDGWTPRIQKNSLQSSELKNLVKRLSKSSGNVWEIVIEGDDLSNISMYTDEGVSCVALVWAKNLMIPLRDTLSFEDLESGLGIQYNGDVKDCGKIFESTPGIKKVN